MRTTISSIALLFLVIGQCFAQSPKLPSAELPKVESIPQPPPRGSSVKKQWMSNKYTNVILENRKKKSKALWVVYADASDHTTYSDLKGMNKLKNTTLMESFYVIKEEGDFVKLVKYNPAILGSKFFPRRIKDIKQASYYGWIEKSKLLLSNRSYVDSATLYPKKYLTTLRSPQSIISCAAYLKKDSIKVFAKPASNAKINRWVGLYQYVYVYKYSADNQFCLVGRSAEYTPDNAAQEVLGWISTSMLQPWGERLYFSPQDKLWKNTSFYSFEMINEPQIKLQKDTLKFVGNAKTTHEKIKAKIDNPTGLVWESELPQASVWYTQLPVKYLIKQQQASFIRTEVPFSLYDKSKRSAFGVDGNKITYNDFKNLINNAKAYNIVFVVDGNKRMASFIPYLGNILQNLQRNFDATYPNSIVNYGGVLYTGQGCLMGSKSADILPLTTKYDKVANFLTSAISKTSSCDIKNTDVAAMYLGLNKATYLFKGHEEENNIIILIGSVGNANEDVSQVIGQIGETNARILCFQARNVDLITANDFVLQSQNILLASAKLMSLNKRKKLVSVDDLTEPSSFRSLTGLKNSFFLNYPSKSMVQGGIIFAERGKDLSASSLQMGIDSLLSQVFKDNTRITSELDSIFMRVNYRNEPFNPFVVDEFEALGFGAIGNQPECFNKDSFIYTRSLATDTLNKTYQLVLNADEYTSILNKMKRLSGQGLKLEKASSRRKLFKKYINEIREANVRPIKRSAATHMKLADALSLITGYPVRNQLLLEPVVRDLKRKKKMNKESFMAIVKHLQFVTKNIVDNEDKNKFDSNGANYYVLSSQEMP